MVKKFRSGTKSRRTTIYFALKKKQTEAPLSGSGWRFKTA